MLEVPNRGNVRQPLWRGVREVSALWFSADWLAPELREVRMLELWDAGCRAWRFDQGDVLCFARPRTFACERAPGLVLCRVGASLHSAALSAREQATLPVGDVLLVLAAQVIELRFDQARILDLSVAIDTGDYALHDTYDCQLAAPTLTLPRLAGSSTRQLLGQAIPPASAESTEFLQRLAGTRGNGSNATAESLRQRAGAVRDGVVGLLLSAVFKLLPGLGQARPAARGGLPTRQSAPTAQPWRERLARLAIATRVAKLIGFRQSAYLRRMLGMFERGDLDEALRNALPLDGLEQSLGQAFSTPQRRDSLQLSRQLGGASSLDFGDELRDHLRRLYRRAFEKFDTRGDVDQAVFVLAELLNARQEALDYLVKHGRQGQAAELALGWDMPAGMCIRLLMLAGEVDRALQVARRDGAFSEAILLLQPTHPVLAAQLRLEWGQALIQGGHFLAAVDAVWPLPQARNLALHWLLSAERAGAEMSARALVQRAQLAPDTLTRHAEKIEALADPCALDTARFAMAQALLSTDGSSAAVRALATAILPAVAADRALSAKNLDKLLKLSNDPWLKADVPAWETPRAAPAIDLWTRATPLLLQPPAAGLHAIFDAAALPDRRYLVALGEAGVAVVDAQGRIKQRYAVPAFKLVLADSGHVALAIAPRQRVSRIARLDLVGHASDDLGVMALQFFAPTYNGIGWSVVVENRILVIDTCKPSREVLWHLGDLPGPVLAAAYFCDRERYLVRTGLGLQDWTFVLPGRRLQPHAELALDAAMALCMHRLEIQQPRIRMDDGHIVLSFRCKGVERSCLLGATPDGEFASRENRFESSFAALESGFLVGLHHRDGSRYFLVRIADGAIVARIDWPAGARAVIREQPGHLLFHDHQGRLLDLAVDQSLAHPISLI